VSTIDHGFSPRGAGPPLVPDRQARRGAAGTDDARDGAQNTSSTSSTGPRLSVPSVYSSTSSRTSSDASLPLHIVKNVPCVLPAPPFSSLSTDRVPSGYHTPVFAGKAAQRQKVEAFVLTKGFLPKELVALEVAWFYDNLGIEVRTLHAIYPIHFCPRY
jgi:hypothetical protein